MVDKLPEEIVERTLIEYKFYLKNKDKKIDKNDSENLAGLIYQLLDGDIKARIDQNEVRIYYKSNSDAHIKILTEEFDNIKYFATLMYNVAKDKGKIEIYLGKNFSTKDHAKGIPKINVRLPSFPYIYLRGIKYGDEYQFFRKINKYNVKIKTEDFSDVGSSSVPGRLYVIESNQRIPELENNAMFGIDYSNPNLF